MKTENIAKRKITVCILVFLLVLYAGCTTTPSQTAKPSHAAEEAARFFDDGVRFNEENNFDQAINSFTEAIRVYPSFQEALVARGLVYYVLERHSEALLDLTYVINLGPQDTSFYVTAHMVAGRIHNASGEYENALKNFNSVLRIAPISDAFNERSRAHLQLGMLPEALMDINFAIRLDHENYVLFSNRGTVFYEMGLLSRALNDFITSLNLNNFFALAAANAGKIAKDLGQYELSLDLYNHAIFLEPDFLYARLGRGNLFLILAELAADISTREEFLEKAMSDFERTVDVRRARSVN